MFEWIYSSITLYGESFNENASQQHRDMLLEMLDILSEMLSWPWPAQSDARSARMDVGITFITPDPSFEPILFKKSLVPFLSTLYFANRFDSALPQSIVNILNLFASIAPASFSVPENYTLHLLLLCDFVRVAACAPYLQAVEKEGRSVDVAAMEGESWEKLQLLLLLKPVLCTGYASALLATPQWGELKASLQQLFAQLFQVAFSLRSHAGPARAGFAARARRRLRVSARPLRRGTQRRLRGRLLPRRVARLRGCRRRPHLPRL